MPKLAAISRRDSHSIDRRASVEEMQRLAAMTRLILAMRGDGGATASADRAWLLAVELASMLLLAGLVAAYHLAKK